MQRLILSGLAIITILGSFRNLAWAAPTSEASTVCRIKVLSNAVPDLTSVDDFIKAVVKPGMTDAQKCFAVWDAYWRLRFPNAGSYCVEHGQSVMDPIIALTSFGGTICGQDACLTGALWAAMGFDVRYWEIVGHTVGEVYYDGRWHMLDGAAGLYFTLEDNKTVAGVEDLQKWLPYDEKSCSNWGKFGKEAIPSEPGHLCVKHCPVCNDESRLKEHGYKLYGDKDLGPGKNNNEVQKIDTYEVGHCLNLTLRKGETWKAYWQPLGMEEDYWRPSSGGKRPVDMWDLGARYVEQKGGGQTNWGPEPLSFTLRKDAAYANGELVTLFDTKHLNKDLFESVENVTFGTTGAVIKPKTGGRPASFVLRIDLPYVITGGWLMMKTARTGADAAISVEASTDWGTTWKQVHTASGAGKSEENVRLYPHVAGGFGYMLRIVLKDNSAIEGLAVRTITAVNPFALPRLHRGKNTITVEIGEQTATTFFWPDLGNPESTTSFEQAASIRVDTSNPWTRGYHSAGAGAKLVKRVAAPGPVKRLVWGGRFRRSGEGKMDYSLDGQTWQNQAWTWKYALPPEKAWEGNGYPMILERTEFGQGVVNPVVRYTFGGTGFLMTMLRVGCDYVPPGASGNMPPLELVYCYRESTAAQPVMKAFRVTKESQTFTIDVGGTRPMMEWYSVGIAEK